MDSRQAKLKAQSLFDEHASSALEHMTRQSARLSTHVPPFMHGLDAQVTGSVCVKEYLVDVAVVTELVEDNVSVTVTLVVVIDGAAAPSEDRVIVLVLEIVIVVLVVDATHLRLIVPVPIGTVPANMLQSS